MTTESGRRVGPADAALTAALIAVTVLTAWLLPANWFEGRPLDVLGALALVAQALPVLVRRRWPLPALLVGCAAAVPYHAVDYPHEIALPPVMVLLYAAVVTGTRKRTIATLVPIFLVIALTIGLTQDGPPGVEIAAPLGWLIVATVFGEAVRQHRQYVDGLQERAARGVAEERLRIARDLHDVLAHNIVVINAHAGVAAHLLDEDRDNPALARIAAPLRTVAEASSKALAELRTTLDVLRGNETDSDRQPTPGLDRLPELADATRSAGVAVAVEEHGERRELGQAVEITLYRITQEALTNVVKHAEAARATVRLDYRDERVRLEITDDGRGGNGRRGSGYGIIGMTERAAVLGGRLTAGPGTHGGFTVTADLPAKERQ
ncbi:sensor histidine kinase [Amycolatopsis sp. YIM 10]|uniref:sensor histidine kinase n=1 Tax=Amycolatopsis sp. YIM 10 TaxID=2653857 RepID=UPI0012906C6F|nr:histidine kinase [Amycolatopsis sp. YIM 10]QFU92821.1 Sensor histidine kinase LiaS [Amycolatopsis sp. YIM 10]